MSRTSFQNRLLVRITAPANEPLTLHESKHYLRIDHENDDALINHLIVTARMHAENWLRRSLISQTWKLGYDDGLPACVSLPMGPVRHINNITIVHKDAATTVVDSNRYHLNSAKTQLMLDSSITGFHIEISYDAGYGDSSDDLPAPVRQGMLCHMASLYENRGEDIVAIPQQAYTLYMPFREVLL
jgi:uncharacterized phiE125 gp8 family phage protein